MLTAVCCLLIKGNARGKESFSWYEKGINEEISLTRIYEYSSTLCRMIMRR